MTPVILETGVETTVPAIRAEHPGLMFGQGSDLSHIGIGWLVQTPQPGPGYTRGPNELVEGEWRMTWLPPTLDALKAEKQSALSAEYQSRIQSFPWDFGAPFGVLHLQLRDVTDQANWLTLQCKAQMLIAAGQGDAEVLAIRTEENITVPVTANVAAQVMDALSSFGGNMKAHQWALKDAIMAAEDQAALDAIDITAGWPA